MNYTFESTGLFTSQLFINFHLQLRQKWTDWGLNISLFLFLYTCTHLKWKLFIFAFDTKTDSLKGQPLFFFKTHFCHWNFRGAVAPYSTHRPKSFFLATFPDVKFFHLSFTLNFTDFKAASNFFRLWRNRQYVQEAGEKVPEFRRLWSGGGRGRWRWRHKGEWDPRRVLLQLLSPAGFRRRAGKRSVSEMLQYKFLMMKCS